MEASLQGVAPAGGDLVSLLFTPKMVWVEAPFIRVGSAPERVGLGHEGLPSCLNYMIPCQRRWKKSLSHTDSARETFLELD